MFLAFTMGMAYGVGGTAFNLSIRHIGFALTYAIAVGLSAFLTRFALDRHADPTADTGRRRYLREDRRRVGSSRRGCRGLRHRHLRRRRTDEGEQSASDNSEGELSPARDSCCRWWPASFRPSTASLEACEPIVEVATKLRAGDSWGDALSLVGHRGLRHHGPHRLPPCRHRTLGQLTKVPAGAGKPNLP